MKKTFKSPGKVNLFLRITGMREDGYHCISSLMSKISLFDFLEIDVSSGDGVDARCPGNPALEGPGNLVNRAAKLLVETLKIKRAIKIVLAKNIPVGAGLGGGSSNAAWVLRGINEMLGAPLDDDELAKLGLKIGADVPFFIYDGSALVEGIGEEVRPLKGLSPLELVVVYPGFEISTKTVYSLIKEGLTGGVLGDNKNHSFQGSEVIIDLVHNDLEGVAFELEPRLQRYKTTLEKAGAVKASMSGSGSSIFGIFKDRQTADRAFDGLKKENFGVGTAGGSIRVFRVTTID